MINKRLYPPILNNLTPPQEAYLNSPHRFTIIPAGRRSRKTLIGKRKTLRSALENNNHRYFCAAPTFTQAKRIFWNDLKRDTHYFRSDKSETELMVRLLNGSEIYVIGMDKPERVEGQPWDGCHLTEFGNMKPTTWGENVRPVLSDTGGWSILDGVPEGFNHYHDMTLKACDGVIPKTVLFDGSIHESQEMPGWIYYHWWSEDVLPAEEIELARNELDERTFNQEYRGSFESYGGRAYYAFGKHNLDVNAVYNPKETVFVGMDFNVNPMTAVFTHIRNNTVVQFGEAYLPNSNTYEMAELLKKKFGPGRCIIRPDSTGKSRSANATKSNLGILRNENFRVQAKSSNPLQIDRINAMNSILKDRGSATRYKIHPTNCPKTANDFNKVQTLDDGRIDKRGERTGLVHLSDAAGYNVVYDFSVIKPFYGSMPR